MTGARRGELCALQWKHVDHERRQLMISRSILQLPAAPLIEKDTKTPATRKISLDVRTLELLRELREKQEARAARFGTTVKDDGYVFSHEIDASQSWRPDYATLAFGRFAKELNLPGLRLLASRSTNVGVGQWYPVASNLAARPQARLSTGEGHVGDTAG